MVKTPSTRNKPILWSLRKSGNWLRASIKPAKYCQGGAGLRDLKSELERSMTVRNRHVGADARRWRSFGRRA